MNALTERDLTRGPGRGDGPITSRSVNALACTCDNRRICLACCLVDLWLEWFGASEAVTVVRTAKPLAVISSDASTVGVKA